MDYVSYFNCLTKMPQMQTSPIQMYIYGTMVQIYFDHRTEYGVGGECCHNHKSKPITLLYELYGLLCMFKYDHNDHCWVSIASDTKYSHAGLITHFLSRC
jgi:hypothetical protein